MIMGTLTVVLVVTLYIKPSQAAQKASEPGRRFRGEVEHCGGQELPAQPAKKIQQLGEGLGFREFTV